MDRKEQRAVKFTLDKESPIQGQEPRAPSDEPCDRGMAMNHKRIESFAPIVSEKSKVLILGTMPGAESLKTDQYYAGPQKRVLAHHGRVVRGRSIAGLRREGGSPRFSGHRPAGFASGMY